MKTQTITAFIIFLFSFNVSYSQCCGGGSGSPVAGGTSQGVLGERQMEISTNYQYIHTTKFFKGDAPVKSNALTQIFDTTLKGFTSHYNYFRLAYGVTKDFTMSLESGYYFDKKQLSSDTNKMSSSGIGDLIIFPRYDIYNRTKEDKHTEITLGMGWKIPLGKYNDSLMQIVWPNDTFYTTLPPSVQPSTGSNDFIFYTFLYRGYPLKNFRVFANAMYIKKGWNPLGEKFGDYAGIGLFAGKTFFKALGVTLQVKGEWIDKAKLVEYASPNFGPEETGNKKVSIVPQLSYNYKKLTVYALSEFPVYQYVNKTQLASQYQFSLGISYRFYILPRSIIPKIGETVYCCSMNCKGGESNKPGKCRICGMDLKQK